jgi:hypothetical protein
MQCSVQDRSDKDDNKNMESESGESLLDSEKGKGTETKRTEEVKMKKIDWNKLALETFEKIKKDPKLLLQGLIVMLLGYVGFRILIALLMM